MPTYEYRCPEGHEFEKFTQKMSDAQSELPCPTCGKVAPRRMSAGGGLLFKGSGFYITDYGKDGKKDQRAAAAKSESAGDSSKSSTAETTASAPATGAPASGAAGGTASTTSSKGTTSPAAPAKGESSKGESSKAGSGKGDSGKGDSGKKSGPAT